MPTRAAVLPSEDAADVDCLIDTLRDCLDELLS